MFYRIGLILALALACPAGALADSLTVSDMAFGAGIENHAVVGVDTTFSADAGRVYCWTVIQGASGEDTVYHTWTRDGSMIQKVPLVVRSANWRTHSYKTMSRGLEGTWRVEVTDRAGRTLATDEVVVTAPGSGQP